MLVNILLGLLLAGVTYFGLGLVGLGGNLAVFLTLAVFAIVAFRDEFRNLR